MTKVSKEVITSMAEERTKPSRIPIAQYQELETKYHKLERSIWKNRVGSGTIGAGVGAVITYLLMHSCNGKPQYTTNPTTPTNIYTFVTPCCDQNSANKSKPTYDNKQCSEGKICLDSDLENKLKKCLDENAELKKRPKHCPKYTPTTPNQCPPAPKCTPAPYIRQGE